MQRRGIWLASAGLTGLGLLVATLGPARPLAAERLAQETAGQTISTVGEGIGIAVNDKARLALAVEATDVSIAVAQEKVGRQVAAVRQAIEGHGVLPGNVRTLQFMVGPRYEHKEPRPQPSGYFATHVLEVETTRLAGLAPLLSAVLEAGVTRVDGIQFQASNPKKAFAAARSAALKDAQEKVEQLAQESGLTVTGVLRVEELDGQQPANIRMDFMPGSDRVRSSLRVSWSVK